MEYLPCQTHGSTQQASGRSGRLQITQDPAALWQEWERRCAAIASRVAPVAGVKTETFVPSPANAVPHLKVAWDAAALGVTPADAVKRLRDGEPRIEVRAVLADGLEIGVWMLEPGEEEIVGRRLREALQKA